MRSVASRGDLAAVIGKYDALVIPLGKRPKRTLLKSRSSPKTRSISGRTRREISALFRGAPKAAGSSGGALSIKLPIESLERGLTVILGRLRGETREMRRLHFPRSHGPAHFLHFPYVLDGIHLLDMGRVNLR